MWRGKPARSDHQINKRLKTWPASKQTQEIGDQGSSKAARPGGPIPGWHRFPKTANSPQPLPRRRAEKKKLTGRGALQPRPQGPPAFPGVRPGSNVSNAPACLWLPKLQATAKGPGYLSQTEIIHWLEKAPQKLPWTEKNRFPNKARRQLGLARVSLLGAGALLGNAFRCGALGCDHPPRRTQRFPLRLLLGLRLNGQSPHPAPWKLLTGAPGGRWSF